MSVRIKRSDPISKMTPKKGEVKIYSPKFSPSKIKNKCGGKTKKKK